MKSRFPSLKPSFPAQCIFLLAVCFWPEASFRAAAQTPTPTPQTFSSPLPALPQDIPKTDYTSFGYSTFDSIPATDSASVTVDVDLYDLSASPENLQITVFPGCIDFTTRPPEGVPQLLIWDRELLVDDAGHPVRHIVATAVLPPSLLNIAALPGLCDFLDDFKYTVQALHEGYGTESSVVGAFNSCSLTINPVDPGHIAPPTVNLFGGTQGEPLPAEIDYGRSLTLVATASGNPSSFAIDRLGIVVTDLQSLQVYKSSEIFQPSSADPTPVLTYVPPTLAPSEYQVVAKAIDRAGYSQTITQNLTVKRLFGLFSVSILSSNVDGDEVTSFSAQLHLQNNTLVDSSELRVRLLEVASASVIFADGPLELPPPATPDGAVVGPASALPAGAAEDVTINGTVQAPTQVNGQGTNFINFHVYAVLDEFIDGQWITVDTLKVIDGVQHQAQGFGGPGSGTNDPPGSVPPGYDPMVLDSLAITGPGTVDDGAQATYTAMATAKNSTGSTTLNVVPQWSVSQFTIDSEGHFQAGHVTSNTAVNVVASYTLGGVTKTATKPITIIALPVSGLVNIATRLHVETNQKVMIAGFIINGNDPKTVIIRAIGPTLGNLGVPDVLADPILELRGADLSLIATNDNWKSDQQTEIEETMLQPGSDLESAIVITLPAGSAGYTAIVSGKNGGIGNGLVDVYDLDQVADSSLANISTRGFVDAGDNVMIGAVTIGGETSQILLRAIGPELTPLGVAEALEDTVLDLNDSHGNTIVSNDDWKTTQQSQIEATGHAPTDDRESAILITLTPGQYTAIVRGKDGIVGVALVEAYNVSP